MGSGLGEDTNHEATLILHVEKCQRTGKLFPHPMQQSLREKRGKLKFLFSPFGILCVLHFVVKDLLM